MIKKKTSLKHKKNKIGGQVSSWSRTHVGQIRKKNEDSFLCDSSLMLYAVADGMGGHAGGEIASQIALTSLQSTISAARTDSSIFPNPPLKYVSCAIKEMLARAVCRASCEIFDVSVENPALSGMGTTVTLILFYGSYAYVAHVGDSRLYCLKDGKLKQLTEDHSIVAEQVKAGLMTEEQAHLSNYRHIITRSVGFEPDIAVDTFFVEVYPGDIFLICSDGLTGLVADDEIARVLMYNTFAYASDELISLANHRGGEDNITLILLRYKGNKGYATAAEHKRILHRNVRVQK